MATAQQSLTCNAPILPVRCIAGRLTDEVDAHSRCPSAHTCRAASTHVQWCGDESCAVVWRWHE